MVKSGRVFSLVLALGAMLIAPVVALHSGGIFAILRKVNGCYAIPILAVMVCALFTRRIPAAAAKFAIIFGSVSYLLAAFVLKPEINALHLQGIIFAITVVGMALIGKIAPRETPFIQSHSGDVDITPWRFAYPVAAFVVLCASGTYLYFPDNTRSGSPARKYGIEPRL